MKLCQHGAGNRLFYGTLNTNTLIMEIEIQLPEIFVCLCYFLPKMPNL